MERRVLLLEGEVRRGELLCRDEGCYMLCTVDVPKWENGVKKVWLCSQGGGRVLLGTLLPEGDRFRLRRRVSHSTLRCCGVSRADLALVNPEGSAPDWKGLSSLSLPDPELSRQLREHPQGLWRREGETLLLRFPWRAGQRVPVMSLFCFARPRDGWWEVELPAGMYNG
jgi:hypothetical protein